MHLGFGSFFVVLLQKSWTVRNFLERNIKTRTKTVAVQIGVRSCSILIITFKLLHRNLDAMDFLLWVRPLPTTNRLFGVDKLHCIHYTTSTPCLTNGEMNGWTNAFHSMESDSEPNHFNGFVCYCCCCCFWYVYKQYVIDENAWQRFDHLTKFGLFNQCSTLEILEIYLLVDFNQIQKSISDASFSANTSCEWQRGTARERLN